MCSAELRELLVPPLRADISALEKYVFESEAPLSFPISAFGGTQDSMVRALRSRPGAHTASAFQLRMLEGDHLFIQTAKRDLIRMVSAILRESNEPHREVGA